MTNWSLPSGQHDRSVAAQTASDSDVNGSQRCRPDRTALVKALMDRYLPPAITLTKKKSAAAIVEVGEE
jgi:hypothetical protein